MIIERRHFDLSNQCVIEKLLIKTPFKYGAIFQDEACFLHIKEGISTLISPAERITIHTSESVLLKCGNYFADLVQSSKSEYCEVFAVHLHADILKELYKDEIPSFVKPAHKKYYAKKIEDHDIIVHFIKSLEFYFQNPKLVNEDLLKLKIKELILLLLQTNNSGTILGLFSHLFTPRQARLTEIIQTHLYSNLTISELARLSGRSLSAFKREFEAYFKDTPANYIKEQRLSKAHNLLISTDFSIQEICYEVGYSEASYFTKLFKHKYGIAPLEYRKSKILI